MPEAVVHDHVPQVLDAAFHLLEPHRRARQAIRSADVEHQEAVDVLDARLLIDVRGEQVGVPRLGAAVAAHVQVPAFLGGDDAEVFALRFGALAHAAADRALQLVRRADAAVALLDADREADRVLHAVATPRAIMPLEGAQQVVHGGLDLHAGEVHADALVHAAAEGRPRVPVGLVLAPVVGEPAGVEALADRASTPPCGAEVGDAMHSVPAGMWWPSTSVSFTALPQERPGTGGPAAATPSSPGRERRAVRRRP